jgi:hypothetical protein
MQRSRWAAAKASTSWLVRSQSSSAVGDRPVTHDQLLERKATVLSRWVEPEGTGASIEALAADAILG